MQYYVGDKFGHIVAKFASRRNALRYAHSLQPGLPFFFGNETATDYRSQQAAMQSMTLCRYKCETPEQLLAVLADAKHLQRGHYSVRQALVHLFAIPGAKYTLAQLMEYTQAPRITVACQLTAVRKLNGIAVVLSKDKKYSVRQEPTP